VDSDNTGLYVDAARAYAAHSAVNFCNALYERPAMLGVIGNVAGKHVVDAGCAGGEYAARLVERGARVTALDASNAMVSIVKARFGDTVDVRQHDLCEPLAWLGDGSVDVVLSSLTLHYLRDWSNPLREFHRILKPGGIFVMSTHHPSMVERIIADKGSYFDVRLVRDTWNIAGEPHEVRFYHRPLQDIVNSVIDAGFTIRRLIEPRLDERPAEMPAEWFQTLSTAPWFLILHAVTASRPPAL
jgi:SAM-dependent methyltransferase